MPTVPVEKGEPISHVRVVTINDNEEVSISSDAQQDFIIADVTECNESAFKCSGCQMLTIHQGLEFIIDHLGHDRKARRLYVCGNCGKAGLK